MQSPNAINMPAIRAASIARIMKQEGCIYPIARGRLALQMRLMRREVYTRAKQERCTPLAAFYMLQDQLNKET